MAAESEAKLHMIENDPERRIAVDQTDRIHGMQREMAEKEKEYRMSLKQMTLKNDRRYSEIVAERDQLKARIAQLEEMLNKQDYAAANMDDLAGDLKFWKDECAKLQVQLHTQKELHKTIAEQEALLKGQESLVQVLREQLAQANADMAKKDEDYESLLGLKVALDMEIKSYRWLLENEECRLGLGESESKKRKTSVSYTPGGTSYVSKTTYSTGGSGSSAISGLSSSETSVNGSGSSISLGGSSGSSISLGGSSGSSISLGGSSVSSYSSRLSSGSSLSGLTFEQIDTDKSGGITRDEWEKVMRAKLAP